MTKKRIVNPVSIGTVIQHLFQNEKAKKGYDDDVQKIYFSKCSLSSQQKQGLTYPEGFLPLDIYIIQQNDQSDLTLISFLKKSDDLIYGTYFSVQNQEPFDCKILTDSKKPIQLSDSSTFTSTNYIEVYHDVDGTTTIMGLKNSPTQPYSTIQYARHHKYYYIALYSDGIDEPTPRYKLTGLSKNLQKL